MVVDATQLLFNGQYADPEDGLLYLRARMYDPGTGQFITADPVASSTRDRYGYAGQDPLDNTDPTGLFCVIGHNSDGGCRGAGAYDWGVEHLDPVYLAAKGYGNEWDAAKHGCSFWTVFKYGAEGVAGVAATGLLAGGLVVNAVAGVAANAGARTFGNFAATDLREAAQAEDRNGLTQVGRALQKHSGREGSLFSGLTSSSNMTRRTMRRPVWMGRPRPSMPLMR